MARTTSSINPAEADAARAAIAGLGATETTLRAARATLQAALEDKTARVKALEQERDKTAAATKKAIDDATKAAETAMAKARKEWGARLTKATASRNDMQARLRDARMKLG